MTYKEVLEFLNVTRQTVDNYRRAGKLTAKKSKVNGRVFFNRKEVEQLRKQVDEL